MFQQFNPFLHPPIFLCCSLISWPPHTWNFRLKSHRLPLLDRVDHVSGLQAHPALLRTLSHARFTSGTCTTRASGGGSKFGVHRRFPTQRHRCILHCWSLFPGGIFPQHVAAVPPANLQFQSVFCVHSFHSSTRVHSCVW